MARHEDYCTLLKNEEDRDILTRRLFNVNMRLMWSSLQYRNLVLKACSYIRWCATTEKYGYKKPHGYSGANAGIPWNIIAVGDRVMINPRVVQSSGEREGLSNCGSLVLDKPIKIRRFAHVVVEYFNEQGSPCTIEGYLPTEQHEIDHNNGILITDRRV